MGKFTSSRPVRILIRISEEEEMMKLFVVALLAFFISACGGGAQPVSNTNARPAPANGERPQSVLAHSTENAPATPIPANGSFVMPEKKEAAGEAIDTAKFDGSIDAVVVSIRKSPTDAQLKKTLAQAYFDRAFALTQARQYASALGDYRRALKYDPAHEEAKKWVDQIVSIYASLKKDPPKEGDEPPPLPFKKQ